jgi:hypothetical protein
VFATAYPNKTHSSRTAPRDAFFLCAAPRRVVVSSILSRFFSFVNPVPAPADVPVRFFGGREKKMLIFSAIIV